MSAPKLLVPTLVAALTACAVGPHYTRPAAPAADQWLEQVNSAPVDLGWWRSFNDPALDELIETAVARNFDLKTAEARLRQARANRDAVAGHRFPEVNVNGEISRNAWSENGPIPVNRIPGFERDYNLFQATFDASWEIDLWGHTARAVQAAQARAESADDVRRDTLMRVVTEVARSYVDLRKAQRQLTSARADANSRAGVARLVE